MRLDLDLAQRMIEAAVAYSAERDLAMCVAVCDAGGNLVAFARMDGAWMGSADVACKKAWTAAAFDGDTGDLGIEAAPGRQFYGIQHSNDGKVMVFAGGVPVHLGGELAGGVGVSGGSGVDDHAVAVAAANAVPANYR